MVQSLLQTNMGFEVKNGAGSQEGGCERREEEDLDGAGVKAIMLRGRADLFGRLPEQHSKRVPLLPGSCNCTGKGIQHDEIQITSAINSTGHESGLMNCIIHCALLHKSPTPSASLPLVILNFKTTKVP